MEALDPKDMKIVKKKKKEKLPSDLRSVFDRHVKAIQEAGVDSLKFPWMHKKSFRLISDAEELKIWIEQVMAGDRYPVPKTDEMLPAVAVDTETTGLDNRVIMKPDGSYSIRNEIAGICLSSDGYEGIYIPVTHEDGNNIDRKECKEILQEFFNNCLLIFYNAKYDKEVLKLLMDIDIREYPYIEDVQVDAYLEDPKADFGDKGHNADGLKYQSKTRLNMEQIELGTLSKVKADMYNKETGKTSLRMQHAPFNWVPTDIALWYAAGDAICTWLLWELMRDEARKLGLAHKIDHQLIDTITWVERQRFHVDVKKLKRITKWHAGKLKILRDELEAIAEWDIVRGPGSDDEFNPGSPPQLVKILFDHKGFEPFNKSEKTGIPSTDAETLEELAKAHPDDLFLKKLQEYRAYASLHPGNLCYDPVDHSARIYLRQCVVAGGRLSATGGDFEKDGGFGLNIQAIKRVEGNKWVKGRKIQSIPEVTYSITDLDPSCYKTEEIKVKKKNPRYGKDHLNNSDWVEPEYLETDEIETKYILAKGIKGNHYAEYFSDLYCLVPGCKTCDFVDGVVEKVDSEEILNIRSLFIAKPGYTFFTTDYSNIEMRVAANISKESSFISEFLEGEGDFHSLTARAVFPEYTNPKTPKDRKKFLRSLAKILNFALLYGGTAYTIFESMKKVQKNITFEECKVMVEKYWEKVPEFAAWVKERQDMAKNKMICKTVTGRVIKFDSAMRAQKIFVPTSEHKENYRRWWEIKNAIKELEGQEGSGSNIARLRKTADAMYFDKETGVRNHQDYKKFLGKIQRVSINIPLQGLAGDFMRLALNHIRLWSQSDCGVESVYELHGSVHDEIDYSVKNEYVPFIIPRLTRLMKLRDIHERQKWPVPIECDTEYGRSWDVTEHLTGDSGHEPAGWTMIEGLESYIPGGVDFDKVYKALASEDTRDKALIYLEMNLNPRTKEAQKVLKEYAYSGKEYRRQLIVCYQLDEYWNIDQEPDDSNLETISEYELRMGLDPNNRPALPVGGRLGTISMEYKVPNVIQIKDVAEEIDEEVQEEPDTSAPVLVMGSEPEEIEYEYDKDGIVYIRDEIDDAIFQELNNSLGIGNNKCKVHYRDQILTLQKVFKTEVPDIYKRVKKCLR
jgi:DNA polymerase I-like protein with 3'-5' exonuclease and polymerase domains